MTDLAKVQLSLARRRPVELDEAQLLIADLMRALDALVGEAPNRWLGTTTDGAPFECQSPILMARALRMGRLHPLLGSAFSHGLSFRRGDAGRFEVELTTAALATDRTGGLAIHFSDACASKVTPDAVLDAFAMAVTRTAAERASLGPPEGRGAGWLTYRREANPEWVVSPPTTTEPWLSGTLFRAHRGRPLDADPSAVAQIGRVADLLHGKRHAPEPEPPPLPAPKVAPAAVPTYLQRPVVAEPDTPDPTDETLPITAPGQRGPLTPFVPQEPAVVRQRLPRRDPPEDRPPATADETVLGAAAPRGKVLPFGASAEETAILGDDSPLLALVPSALRTSLEAYAALQAELAQAPEAEQSRALSRHGLDADRKAALDRHWRSALDADAKLVFEYFKLLGTAWNGRTP